MPVSNAKRISIKKYRTQNYDTIGFDVKKGKRDEYKAKAAELGMSLAAFLTIAADTYANGQSDKVIVRPQGEKLAAEQRQLIDTVYALPPKARKQLIKFLETLAG